MKIIMLGAPGAGKGTQADRIAEKEHIPHISTGDIFRENIKNGTELGKQAKTYMDAGSLVPDELTVAMLLDRVAQKDCENGYVLDGFPRTIPQAGVLEEELEKRNDRVDFAINIEVPDENIIHRMSGRRSCPKCGSSLTQRDDDKAETVKHRLEVYHEQTQPLIHYYEDKKILKTVDGTKDMDDVFTDICQILS